MDGKFGYCGTCKNKGMCRSCYRGSHYEHDWEEEERGGQYGTY